MANNYIDLTRIITVRYHFKDDADMQKVKEFAEKDDIDSAFDDSYDYADPIWETARDLEPEEQNGCSTIEIFENDKLIFANGKDVNKE